MTDDIAGAATVTAAAIPGHYTTLLGERPAGSRWGREFTEDDWFLAWEEVKVEGPLAVEGCRYFRLTGEALREAFPTATLQAIPLCDLDPDAQKQVKRRPGAHGDELVLPVGLTTISTGVVSAWVILGQHEGQEVVFTAHPGPLMLPCLKDGSDLDYSAPIAVKLI